MLRQYLTKGTNLANHTQAQLDVIAEKLNNRLRECLEFDQWLLCAAMASVVLWYREVRMLVGRRFRTMNWSLDSRFGVRRRF